MLRFTGPMYDIRDCVNIEFDADSYTYCSRCCGIIGSYFGGMVVLFGVIHVRIRNSYIGMRALCENVNCVNTECVRYIARRGIHDYNERYRFRPIWLTLNSIDSPHAYLSTERPRRDDLRCVGDYNHYINRYALAVESYNFGDGRWFQPQVSSSRFRVTGCSTAGTVAAVVTTVATAGCSTTPTNGAYYC